MFIIFGTRGVTHTIKDSEPLVNSCPGCSSGNLIHKLQRRWFTLFFIPVIPLDVLDRFYECDHCKSEYVENIKNLLQQSQSQEFQDQAQVRYLFASSVVACMTHMACIDGHFAESERREIMDFISKFEDIKRDLLNVFEDIQNNSNLDNRVFNKLNESRAVLSDDGIMTIITQSAVVLLADGQIEPSEEALLKEYLIACGLPKSMYNDVIEKLQARNFSIKEEQLN